MILDLEAVWCHWCHVMEAKTYSDPKVTEIIQSKFIAVRVDQDLRLDLSRKYEDSGWPATILFDSNGKEIAKRSGNIPPEDMVILLEKMIKSPVPEENTNNAKLKAPESPYLGEALKKKLKSSYIGRYDKKNAGWGHFGIE